MLLEVAECITVSGANVVRVHGARQRGFIKVGDQVPMGSPSSMELDVDKDVSPRDVELERDDLEAMHPQSEELFLSGILRRFQDGGGLLENADGIILLDFCDDFPEALINVPVRVRFKDVRGIPDNI